MFMHVALSSLASPKYLMSYMVPIEHDKVISFYYAQLTLSQACSDYPMFPRDMLAKKSCGLLESADVGFDA